jgi:hypothetical protein
MAYKDGNSSWEDYRDWYDTQHAQNHARLGLDPLPHTWRYGEMFPDWESNDGEEEPWRGIRKDFGDDHPRRRHAEQSAADMLAHSHEYKLYSVIYRVAVKVAAEDEREADERARRQLPKHILDNSEVLDVIEVN